MFCPAQAGAYVHRRKKVYDKYLHVGPTRARKIDPAAGKTVGRPQDVPFGHPSNRNSQRVARCRTQIPALRCANPRPACADTRTALDTYLGAGLFFFGSPCVGHHGVKPRRQLQLPVAGRRQPGGAPRLAGPRGGETKHRSSSVRRDSRRAGVFRFQETSERSFGD